MTLLGYVLLGAALLIVAGLAFAGGLVWCVVLQARRPAEVAIALAKAIPLRQREEWLSDLGRAWYGDEYNRAARALRVRAESESMAAKLRSRDWH